MADNGSVLGLAGLEQLLNTGKTLGNIRCGCNTAGVEGTHGQLGTRLTDGLGGDDAYRLTDGYRLTVCQVGAVALGADAVLGLAVQDGSGSSPR